jgi:secreted PhoX family phosphatase
MKTSVAAALGASVVGLASGDVEESDTPGAPSVRGELKRFSTTAFGAEVTGPYVFEDGSLLYSLQHPSRDNEPPFDRAGIGYFKDFQFSLDGRNDDFTELSAPQTDAEQRKVMSGSGEYELIAREEDPINYQDGQPTELLGVTQTPDGTNIVLSDGSDEGDFEQQGTFGGTQYGNSASNPDCNEFVATNDEGTEGYLFTNWENSPGNVSRIPLSQTEDGEWEADLANALNLANTEAFRELGGTRINCYGDLSPWNTMVSSEENYAHPRVSLTATVGDVDEQGTGEGIRGAHEFWNRPSPTEIQDAVDNQYDDIEGWYVQGYWALDGVEFLAYYLGATPVDQTGDNTDNTTDPIGDSYPNPYRYGYHVDFREPTADPPQPVKYWVFGRASWEGPDFQSDERTVYGCSDGDSKGIYKFVADQPIPGYDDTDDIAGTLYAPKIANDEAASRNSPAEVDLEVEWIELGHATNGEVKSWVAEYDGITQEDYLDTHAETDWTDDLATALEEADKEVIENGNQDYITDDEIIQWADQWESRGPDNVDEELRRVPFLETRAAAKEIGASIEFNKAEGVDSIDGAEPGDFIYFGISEFNDDMANDVGDLQMDRVDGGVVYRAELEPNYNVSTLEPAIVGPDFTDAPAESDDALKNVDNVYVMDDGRVICCEDGFNDGDRSYPNDALYVYQPNAVADVDSLALGYDTTGSANLTMSSVPGGLAGGKLTLSITDPEVAAFTGVEFSDALGLTEGTISDDGSTATLKFTDLDRNVQPGALDVDLATLELRGVAAGTTDVVVEADRIDNDDGEPADVETRRAVVVTGPPKLPGGEGPPTDPDGDRRYEDVNGNGRLDFDDIVTLFENFDTDAVRLNEAAFDFNGNGGLDFADITALLDEVQ